MNVNVKKCDASVEPECKGKLKLYIIDMSRWVYSFFSKVTSFQSQRCLTWLYVHPTSHAGGGGSTRGTFKGTVHPKIKMFSGRRPSLSACGAPKNIRVYEKTYAHTKLNSDVSVQKWMNRGLKMRFDFHPGDRRCPTESPRWHVVPWVARHV